MIQFLLMLLGLAWGNHNGNTSGYKNSNNLGNQTTTQVAGLEEDLDTGGDKPHGPIGGNTGQTPP